MRTTRGSEKNKTIKTSTDYDLYQKQVIRHISVKHSKYNIQQLSYNIIYRLSQKEELGNKLRRTHTNNMKKKK